MAYLSLTPPLATTNSSLFSSFHGRHGALGSANPRKERVSRGSSKFSCNANPTGGPDRKLDRRDVLLGLGGLYGAAGLGSDPFAVAAPIDAPDLYQAKEIPDDLPKGVVTECRAPPAEQTDFRLPYFSGLRVRPAAHMVDRNYIAKYERALALMKALPEEDPRSFHQQAKIHCAYCNGGYDQNGFGDLDIQVHFNWLFFPFHRWYLYFYERILGKLINDPTFAIPFWNWDAAEGMRMPSMFINPNSPLYNPNRSKAHQPPYLLDLDYDYKNKANNVVKPDNEQIAENYTTMYRQMVSGAKIPSLFFGGEYRAGEVAEKSAGTIENVPHTQIHVLCGSEKDDVHKNGEDMGNFYSAGRDPMFYALHGNVDRMWSIWKTLGGRRRDIDDPDWLNAAFVFYDENARLVRVTVRDCLDTRRLGYVYDNAPIPWLFNKPKPRHSRMLKWLKTHGVARAADIKKVALSDYPITLIDSPITTIVPRPKKGRSAEEKEAQEEVLVVQGIDFDPQVAVKFDVYVNDEDDVIGTTTPDKSEFAGSFGNVPHSAHKTGPPTKISLKLGITDLMDDLGADDDDSVAVTLVPRTGDPITIEGIKIEFLS